MSLNMFVRPSHVTLCVYTEGQGVAWVHRFLTQDKIRLRLAGGMCLLPVSISILTYMSNRYWSLPCIINA